MLSNYPIYFNRTFAVAPQLVEFSIREYSESSYALERAKSARYLIFDKRCDYVEALGACTSKP